MVNYYKTIDGFICPVDACEPGCWVNCIDPDEEALARHRQELEDLIAAVHRKEEQVRTRSIRRYEAALRVLRGNPTAKAREELGEAFESLRKLLER